MTEIKNQLSQAFKADHALLGSNFYTLATSLRNKDIACAKEVVKKINIEAGPHIAFEEDVFYPALERFIETEELEQMYEEHRLGRALLTKVLALDETKELEDSTQKALLAEIDAIETHIAGCGELFGMMGSLTEDETQDLLNKLTTYRLNAPNWLSRQEP